MKFKQLLLTTSLISLSAGALAQDISVKIENLTQGIAYTPFIVAAHDKNISLFTLGQPATPELQAMAEGGDISGLVTMLSNADADIVENPASGLLMPAASTTATFETSLGNDYLSLASMLLPTNDGFTALNAWHIPTEAGTYTFYLNAYDAGTEANNELVIGMAGGASGVLGIPAAPTGNAGSGGSGLTTTESNPVVHVHPGNLGDDDLSGGKSDINNTVHRWLNPVAKVTVTVN